MTQLKITVLLEIVDEDIDLVIDDLVLHEAVLEQDAEEKLYGR